MPIAGDVGKQYPNDVDHPIVRPLSAGLPIFVSQVPPDERLFACFQKDTRFWFIVLTKPQWTPPPTQLQFSHSAHTEFVICDYAIEDAFNTVKRLLGLAYFWTGSQNGVELQIWGTWLVYMVLIDLSDAVAEALNTSLLTISMEMIYRGLYHFGQAYAKGKADDPVTYLVLHAKLLGIVKRKPPVQSLWLNLTILPDP